MAFIDIHCHTFFKPNWLLGDTKTLLKQNIEIEIDRNHEKGVGNLLLRIFSGGLKEILNSQSSLKQIHDGKGIVIVANVVALENAYASLDFCFFKNVFQYIQGIDKAKLTAIEQNQISYSELIDSEIKIISAFNGQDLNGLNYKIINHFDEIDNSGNILNVILAIEGGHGFYTRKKVFEQEDNPQEVIEALIDWKVKSKSGTKPRLLYITPTHHAANCLANHAFAVPTNFAGDGTNEKAGGFNPVGNGLTPTGEEFIRTALRENANEDRILIDLKHLSLRSRLQFYDLRQSLMENEGFTDIPILASHMGVTGLSLTDRIVSQCIDFEQDSENCFEVEYDLSLRIHGFKISDNSSNNEKHILFNPWSINLYDEEIKIIVESKGLIGLSFDSRILGNENLDDERFSKAEFQPLESVSVRIDLRLNPGDNHFKFTHTNPQTFDDTRYPNDVHVTSVRFNSLEAKIVTDLLSLCQNIIHIIRIGGNEAWNCICIGSDFDGIINPIDAVGDASKIPDMKRDFKKFIQIMVRELNRYFIEKETGEAEIIVPDDFYEKFLSENASQFLAKHFR
jgi:microsomal dipeptidase-like Zn-dependent dipeptidase